MSVYRITDGSLHQLAISLRGPLCGLKIRNRTGKMSWTSACPDRPSTITLITMTLPGPGHKSEIKTPLLFAWVCLFRTPLRVPWIRHNSRSSTACLVSCCVACFVQLPARSTTSTTMLFPVGTNVYLHIIGGVHTDAIMRAHLSIGQG